MGVYSVYSIKEEVARNYFHKSGILYRFIKEYENQKDRIDLQKQYLYITYDFSKDIMISHMKKYFKDDVKVHEDGVFLEILNKNKFISLHIGKKQLKFRSESLQDADEVLFPVLRTFQPYLFIIDHTYENYGWISPIKSEWFNGNRQVLYSY